MPVTIPLLKQIKILSLKQEKQKSLNVLFENYLDKFIISFLNSEKYLFDHKFGLYSARN